VLLLLRKLLLTFAVLKFSEEARYEFRFGDSPIQSVGAKSKIAGRGYPGAG